MTGYSEEMTERANTHGWSVQATLTTLCDYEHVQRERRCLEHHHTEVRLLGEKTLKVFASQPIAGAMHESVKDYVSDIQLAKTVLLLPKVNPVRKKQVERSSIP